LRYSFFSDCGSIGSISTVVPGIPLVFFNHLSLSLSLSLGKCSLGFCREIEGGSDKGLFGIVVVLAVQSAFRLKIYQNKVFFIKKLFLILAHQNDLKT
jgi:hypothetical protein